MTTILSNEEFQRINVQLCDYKNQVYTLEANLKKLTNEIYHLKVENEKLRRAFCDDGDDNNVAKLKRFSKNPLAMAKNFAAKVDRRLNQNQRQDTKSILDESSIPKSSEIISNLSLNKSLFDIEVQTEISHQKNDEIIADLQAKLSQMQSKSIEFETQQNAIIGLLRIQFNKCSVEESIGKNIAFDDIPITTTQILDQSSDSNDPIELIESIGKELERKNAIIKKLSEMVNISKSEQNYIDGDENHQSDSNSILLPKNVLEVGIERDEKARLLDEIANLRSNIIELESKEKSAKEEIKSFIKIIDELNEDKKIIEKRGLKIIKELEKRVRIEKNRANKLQTILKEHEDICQTKSIEKNGTVLMVPPTSAALMMIGSKIIDSDQCSSNESWAHMNELDCSNQKFSSGDSKHGEDSEFSDLDCNIVSIDSNQTNRFIDNPQQPSKSMLRSSQESIREQRSKEIGNTKVTNNLNRDQSLIRSTTSLSTHLFRIVNYIKDKNDSSADGNQTSQPNEKKFQRLIEEILTKNVSLQDDLAKLSDELAQTKSLLKQLENKTVES
ncbi:hypothetical protein SSS_03115 [Sarcoptes scabiei]|uniref:Uncharacterized protein n=1 Tax=Sarcoptes scabiei TaxID=52283 RepID=A0A834R8Y6_SARSC|nr:hypothetical protein SSS_03115 [Sarcoptes scabiei]